jgi:hypothetical protein
LQRIAFERSRVGVVRTEVTNRAGAHLLHLLRGRRWRRRIRRALEELELGYDVGGLPRDLCAFRHLVDAQAHSVEHVLGRQTAVANHFRERLCVGAIRSVAVGRDRTRRGVERVQHAGLGIDQRKAAGERLAGLHERISAAGIENHHAGLELERGKRARVVGHPHCLERHIGCLSKLGINRNEIVLAFQLDAVPAEIDEGDGVRTRALCLGQKIAHGLTQRVLIEIARAGDIKSGSLQCLRHQARVVGRSLERAGLIARIADHQCDTLFRTVGWRRH